MTVAGEGGPFHRVKDKRLVNKIDLNKNQKVAYIFL